MSATDVAELETAPQTIEPTVNYILNDGAGFAGFALCRQNRAVELPTLGNPENPGDAGTRWTKAALTQRHTAAGRFTHGDWPVKRMPAILFASPFGPAGGRRRPRRRLERRQRG